MRRLTSLSFAALAFLFTAPFSQPPKAEEKAEARAAKPASLWRTRLQLDDEDRDWAYVWRPDGIPGTLKFVAADGTVHDGQQFKIGWTPDWWEQDLHKGLRVK